MKNIAILLSIILIPILSGCNDTDDVQKIFTGKTWKMTYITKKGEHKWYTFPGVDEKNYFSYDPTNGTRAFRITFTGSTSDNRINGDFNGSGSVIMNGAWEANGEKKTFRTTVKDSRVVDSNDKLGKYIIEAITKTTSYEGDEYNLYLYFEYNKETLCITFAPER